MTPQQCVIDIFGGIRATARIVNTAPSTVLRWGHPRKRDGMGGMVPAVYFEILLTAAQERGKFLTLEHLKHGKPGIERRIIRRF